MRRAASLNTNAPVFVLHGTRRPKNIALGRCLPTARMGSERAEGVSGLSDSASPPFVSALSDGGGQSGFVKRGS